MTLGNVKRMFKAELENGSDQILLKKTLCILSRHNFIKRECLRRKNVINLQEDKVVQHF